MNGIRLQGSPGSAAWIRPGSTVYWVLLLVVSAFYMLRWPIFAGDTDIWYHMSGGRYFFEHGSIPGTSYFSFIEPEKSWVNYYWLFQALAYAIFHAAGYLGLVVLRVVVLSALLLILANALLKNEQGPRRSLYFWCVFTVFYIALIPRFFVVRPHMFSYLFIVLFLYILEFNPRHMKWLPVAGVLWVNLHGVEYPIMILLCLSYLLEVMILRFRRPQEFSRVHVTRALYLAATMWTVVLNPNGTKLFSAPFVISPHVSSYIVEMRPIAWETLINFHWTMGTLEDYTPLNVLLFLGVVSLVYGGVKGKVRIPHLLIAAGGFYLLTRGTRHYWEGILLCIPLLKAHPLVSNGEEGSVTRAAFALLLALFLAASAVFYVRGVGISRLAYPVSAKKLPNGVAAFLRYVDTGGRVLNGPTSGGYLNWELYPRYRIYMDLENSIFDTNDFYFGNSAFYSEAALGKFVERYEPDYISVSLTNSGFPERIKRYESYVPVFFDDMEVLYANRDKQPRVAERYGFRVINPFQLVGTDVSRISKSERALLLAELHRLDALFPKVTLVNQTIALIHNANENWERSIPYAEELIRNAPELETGYSIKGDAFLSMGRFEDALSLYETALGLEGVETSRLNRKIAHCLQRLDRYDEAYEVLQEAIPPFAVDIGYKDLYEYATAALLSEHYDDALMFYRFAALRVPPDESEWQGKISEKLALFEGEQGRL